ncbi:MAG: cupredoxin domain-containing protein [Solirubrobacteraceae bacterium]
MRIKSLLLPLLAAVVVLAVALPLGQRGGSSASGAKSSVTVAGGSVQVPISMYDFKPPKLTVKVGTRITWMNRDSTAHTATGDNGGFDTGTIAPHQSKTVVFKRAGTFAYHCAFHAFMTGTITVTGQ